MAHLCVYFKIKKILLSLYQQAKEFRSLVAQIKEKDLQRKYDEMRNDKAGWTAHRVGCTIEDRRHCPPIWTAEEKPYVDPHMIFSGFIKVDGVWRDLQLYLSGLKKFTKPKRALRRQQMFKGARMTQKHWQVMMHTTHEDAPIIWWRASWDRAFTEWEE